MSCLQLRRFIYLFFFFNDTATTEIYPLPLHDALPISPSSNWSATRAQVLVHTVPARSCRPTRRGRSMSRDQIDRPRSEEHTSELQSQSNLVCRLLLEKKKKKTLKHSAYDVCH